MGISTNDKSRDQSTSPIVLFFYVIIQEKSFKTFFFLQQTQNPVLYITNTLLKQEDSKFVRLPF